MAPFYGWGSTASGLEPLRGGSLLFTSGLFLHICYFSVLSKFKAHRQKSRKRCFEMYCSGDKACQFSALQGTPRRSYLEKPTIDDKFINKRVRPFIHQICLKRVEKKKLLRRHSKVISLNTFAK